jgi:hypothetical protein
MPKVMFWNIDKKVGFETTICDIVKNEKIDLLLLIEANHINDSLIESGTTLKRKKSPNNSDENLKTPRFYSTNKGFKLEHYHTYPNTKRMSFYFLTIPKKKNILLCGLHLRSKLMRRTETQQAEASVISSYIKTIEKKVPDKRTIVLGDFNVNPFELGMISPMGFNATPSKVIAKNGPREFIKDDYDYFYNPMWNFMGDINYTNGNLKLPGGYYFKNNDDITQTYWNIFDSLILRPNLIDEIDLSSISILESSGVSGSSTFHSFSKVVSEEYQIDRANYSDHLPITFNIKI